MEKEVVIYFVLPAHCEDELSTTDEMQQAFELCRQNQMIPEWISEETCLDKQFNKKDVVVFEKFDGKAFQAVQTRLSIVGPWCIITCLMESLQIPNNHSAVFNMAMHKLTVTASNFNAVQKKAMKDKVELMGGVFSLHVTASVTHLITNSVRTKKYAVANAKGIVVMLESWIEDVWNSSLTRNVKATDEDFNKHKCPCFQNLRVCSTGLDMAERSELQKLLAENGGIFTGKLATTTTDILVCKSDAKSEKYEVATGANIPCVRMEWIYDSVKKGFAQPEENYTITVVASSTPTKADGIIHPDFSMMSIIPGNENNDMMKTSVSDSMNVSLFNMITPQNQRNRQQKENKEPDIVSEIDLQAVRKAGTFLDGCGILLAGFSPEHRDKLVRVLRTSGATRYETLTDRVTQVIVGDPTCHEVKLLGSKAPLVSAGWIQESIRRRQPAPEEPYAIRIGAQTVAPTTPSSPLSKKGLTLLQTDTSVVELEPVRPPEVEEHASLKIYKADKTEEDTLAQLLAQADFHSKCETKKCNETSLVEDEESFNLIFAEKTFKLIGQFGEDLKELVEIIKKASGKVLNHSHRGVVDYAIVLPISDPVKVAAAEIVNIYWLQDCLSNNELLPPKYYHLPVSIPQDCKPLKDCVITLSGYTKYERTFLVNLIEELGAVYQEKFARIGIEADNILASSHLVSLEAKGSKFLAAQRWKKFAVTHEWLLQCAKTGRKLPEEQFLRRESDHEESVAFAVPQVIKEKEIDTTPFFAESKVPLRNEKQRTSPVAAYTENVPTSNKRKSPENENDNIEAPPAKISNNEKDVMITLEDGRVVSYKSFMDDLHEQGVFDTPSPIHRVGSGTPVEEFLERLRREGKIPSKTLTPRNVGEEGASQGTPVGKYIRGLKERNVLPLSPKQGNSSPNDSPLPKSVFDVKTPETPLGRFMGVDEPSPSTRKQWQRCLNRIPHYALHDRPTPPPRRPSTPWSEVKRRAWKWINRDKDEVENPPDVSETVDEPSPPQKPDSESQREVNNQIEELQGMLLPRQSRRKSSRSITFGNGTSISTGAIPTTSKAKDSQADSVGWDDVLSDVVFSETAEQTSGPRKFMMSSVQTSDRSNICNIICSLGGDISALNMFDPTATHTLCCTLARNEKILASMAAGLWVVHKSYVERSGAAGKFLCEEEFELGNPKAKINTASMKETPLMDAIHWWRKKIKQSGKRAFHDMRALIFAKSKPAVARIIEAGGGTIVQASPPFDHNIEATHCLIDTKLSLDLTDFIPLAEQGIPCLNIIYLTNFLSSKTNVNWRDYIMSELTECYS